MTTICDQAAAKRLAAAIINQAVMDYRLLAEQGAVKRGCVVPRHKQYRRVERVRNRPNFNLRSFNVKDVKNLLGFFHEGGGLDDYLKIAGVEISAAAVRRKVFER